MTPTRNTPPRARRSPLAVLAPLLALFLLAAAAHAGAPTQLAEPGRLAGVAVAARPGDGYLLVWQDGSSYELKGRSVSAAGIPAARDVTLTPPVDPFLSSLTAAYSETGTLIVLWSEPSGADQIGVAGALFDADGGLVRMLEYADPIPDPGGLVISEGPSVAPLPGGGFALLTHTGVQTDPLGDPLDPTDVDLHLRRLGANGSQLGPAVRIHGDRAGIQGAGQVRASSEGIVVTWQSLDDDGHRILARLFDLDLSPASPEILVDEAESLDSPRLAVAPAGDFVVVWRGLYAPPFDTNAQARPAVRLQAYDAAGERVGLRELVNQVSDSAQLAPSVTVTGRGTVWVSWLAHSLLPISAVPGPSIMVRPFTLDATPLDTAIDVATTDGVAASLTGADRGALLAWRPSGESPIVVGQVLGPAADEPELPDDLALTSPELPGFRVWVRIGEGEAFARWGTQTQPCLAEALCVAGALPDRAELIVRIAGPKPNGFLWPLLSKLSTSRIDVWIEQLTTGDLQHYVLPGATPGSETLPGLFDREGFEPF